MEDKCIVLQFFCSVRGGGGSFGETKPTEGARDIRRFWVICMYSYIHVHIQSNLIGMGNLWVFGQAKLAKKFNDK